MERLTVDHPGGAVPDLPGTYEFKDASGTVIYVGKANSLRKRLAQYRKPPRGNRGRKMRTIVTEASKLNWSICASELSALERELERIQELRPRHNISGAFFFLYPFIGIETSGSDLRLCFSTTQEQDGSFTLFGAFRSRILTMAAFEALSELAGYFGHRQKRSTSDRAKDKPYSIYASFRQQPPLFTRGIIRFLQGERQWLSEVSLSLLEKPTARRDAKLVQDWLQALECFFDEDLAPLLIAMRQQGLSFPVIQRDLDLIKLRARNQDDEPQALYRASALSR